MSDKLTINNEMRVLDAKQRSFTDELTDEERKKFSAYIVMRYAASVDGDADLQEWYLRSTNERVNQGFFDVGSKHAKLQWLLCTTVSPGMGSQRHYWITPKKKESNNSKAAKLLKQLYPYLNSDEINLLVAVNDPKDIQKIARAHGFDDKDIKLK